MPPRVLLTRTRPDGEVTARRVEAMGFRAVLAPVLAIVPVVVALPDGARPDMVVATSAHAFLHLAADVAALGPTVPLFAVGDASAAAARAAGFADVRSADGDAERLAELILRTVAPAARLLLLAGRPRKPDLERALARAGREVLMLDSYEAQPLPWSDETARDLRDDPPAAALHFSQRSARLAGAAAEAAGLRRLFAGLQHICLSADVAAGLRVGTPSIVIAPRPRLDSLLQALERSLGIV